MLKKSSSSPSAPTTCTPSTRPPPRHAYHPWSRLLPSRLSSSTVTMERSPSGHQQEESLRMEHWLDAHPDFTHEYFVRKATTGMIDGWCLNQAVSQNFTKSSTNFPVSDAHSTASSSRQNSGANTPVRRISAQEFERGGQTLERMVSDVNGTLSFLGASQRFAAAASSKTRRSRAELLALDERELLYELVFNICNDLDVTSLCHKILQNVSLLLNADRCSLFLVEGEGTKQQCLVSKLFDVSANASLDACIRDEVRVPWGTGIVGHVAQSGAALNIPNAYKDSRFNDVVDLKTGYTTRNVLCLPILDAEGKVIGVSQAINKISSKGKGEELFNEHDEKVFASYLAFCGIGLRNAQLYERSQLENRRNQLLLDLARVIFEEQSNVAALIQKIMMHTQSLLQCERCQVLLVDDDDIPSQGVFSQVFDLQASDCEVGVERHLLNVEEELGFPSHSRPSDPRFPINIGITGHVAESGKTLNIPDAYQDHRFDPQVDKDTGFKTQSILCMPIRNAMGFVIGVAQLVNKLDGTPFNNNDQYILEAFIIFCGMGIHNTQMYEQAVKAMAKQSIALEVLSYHAAAPSEEVHRLKKMSVPPVEHFQLCDYTFSDFVFDDDETIKAAIRMFLDLNLLETFDIGYEIFCRWILSVKKNYRNVTYHNWRHAFNVTQTMFAMIKQGQTQTIFGDEEVLALMVGCLCHDLDHRGTNNQFQIQSESPLAQLYSTSTLEHHHFDQCLMILNTKGSEIFGQLNKQQYNRVIRILENAILATDLALYFRFRSEFFTLIDSGQTSWDSETDKNLLRSMMMTACDIAAITKPWKVQQKVASLIANEFFEQGDLEKQQLHINPIDMMNREKKDELPTMQVKFIDSICMPVYQAFAKLDTSYKPLLDGCQNNRDNWRHMQEGPVKIAANDEQESLQHKEGQDSTRKKGSSSQLMLWVLSCVRKSSEDR